MRAEPRRRGKRWLTAAALGTTLAAGGALAVAATAQAAPYEQDRQPPPQSRAGEHVAFREGPTAPKQNARVTPRAALAGGRSARLLSYSNAADQFCLGWSEPDAGLPNTCLPQKPGEFTVTGAYSDGGQNLFGTGSSRTGAVHVTGDGIDDWFPVYESAEQDVVYYALTVKNPSRARLVVAAVDGDGNVLAQRELDSAPVQLHPAPGEQSAP